LAGSKGLAYIGFLEGEEKVLDDLREEFRRALKPYSEALGSYTQVAVFHKRGGEF